MNLGQLKNSRGARKKRKRVGCGPGSGHGKTCCRGIKGQMSRSGNRRRLGFEGGQMPLYRRLPKRGFTNIFRRDYEVVNINTLNRFSGETEITPEVLCGAGLARKGSRVKILGQGTLEKKFKVTVHRLSQKAKQQIEGAGGSWREMDVREKRKTVVDKGEQKKPKKTKTES